MTIIDRQNAAELLIRRSAVSQPKIGLAAVAVLLMFVGGLLGCSKKSSYKMQAAIPNAAADALMKTSQLTLLSLDPNYIDNGTPVPRLEGFRVLGQKTLTGDSRDQVIHKLQDDIAHWNGDRALCFYPRQAFQVNRNGISYSFLICYECSALWVFGTGGPPTVIGITGSSDTFDRILSANNIPLAEPAEKK